MLPNVLRRAKYVLEHIPVQQALGKKPSVEMIPITGCCYCLTFLVVILHASWNIWIISTISALNLISGPGKGSMPRCTNLYQPKQFYE